MKKIRLGILGATGAVGEMMLKVLEEKNIEIEELRLFASRKSVGKKIYFKDKRYTVYEASESSFDGLDVVLGATSNEIAQVYAKYIVKAHAIFIDNSSAFRSNPKIPLIVVGINENEINPEDRIIANPNCATIIALLAVFPIYKLSRINRMIISTYQAVSGAGRGGIEELDQQLKDYAYNAQSHPKCFYKQICNNVIPVIGSLNNNGDTSEELKLEKESRKILSDKYLEISCTCVRVPIMQCHSESIYLETQDELNKDEVINTIKKNPRLIYAEDVATPLEYTNQDKVVVSRLRKGNHSNNAYQLWCCGDQLRIGAATNAIHILMHIFR